MSNSTSNSYHLVLQLLLFFHHDQQLHGRSHKGHQRIELHQYQSHPAVIIYQLSESNKMQAVNCQAYKGDGEVGGSTLPTGMHYINQSYKLLLDQNYLNKKKYTNKISKSSQQNRQLQCMHTLNFLQCE